MKWLTKILVSGLLISGFSLAMAETQCTQEIMDNPNDPAFCECFFKLSSDYCVNDGHPKGQCKETTIWSVTMSVKDPEAFCKHNKPSNQSLEKCVAGIEAVQAKKCSKPK